MRRQDMGKENRRIETRKVRIHIRTSIGPCTSLGICGRNIGSSSVLYFKMTIQPTRRGQTRPERFLVPPGAGNSERRFGSPYRGFSEHPSTPSPRSHQVPKCAERSLCPAGMNPSQMQSRTGFPSPRENGVHLAESTSE